MSEKLSLASASDTKILEFALQTQRVLVTLDADFHALLALSGAKEPSSQSESIEIAVRKIQLSINDTPNPLARVIRRLAPVSINAIAPSGPSFR